MRSNMTGSWRYLAPCVSEKTPPCRAACPLGVPVSDFIEHIENGEINKAAAAILEENPMPSVCGRICVHPCEENCNRGLFDRSVAIHILERYAGDNCSSIKIKKERQKNKHIAIVGAGPSGLSAAYFLLRLGYRITIFEKNPEPGGILRYGIPGYRLPRDVLKRAIGNVLSLYPELRTRAVYGKDFTLKDLESFDAVFFGTGAQEGREIGLHSGHPREIISGIDLLRLIDMGDHAKIGNKIVIIGGGNTAIDAARSLLRLGRKPVILYRRDIEDMPAFKKEVSEALREGVLIETRAIVKEIVKEEGSIIGVSCARVNIDRNGKDGKPDKTALREIDNSRFFIEAENIVTATGEVPDLSIMPENIGCSEGKIGTDRYAMTSIPGIFAGGDLINQPHLVVHALASGKRAAISMDAWLCGASPPEFFGAIATGQDGLSFKEYSSIRSDLLKGKEILTGVPQSVCGIERINLDYFEHVERTREKKLPLSERINTFHEVHTGFDAKNSMSESARCFHCGRCVLCGNCITFCPDISITSSTKHKLIEIDFDYCKGCGLCSMECPRGVIGMKRSSVE